MKTLLGLEESGNFEQVEKMVNEQYSTEDPKGIFSVHEDDDTDHRPTDGNLGEDLHKDSLDITGMETLKRMTTERETTKKPVQAFKKDHPSKVQTGKQQLFECDVSEIPVNSR